MTKPIPMISIGMKALGLVGGIDLSYHLRPLPSNAISKAQLIDKIKLIQLTRSAKVQIPTTLPLNVSTWKTSTLKRLLQQANQTKLTYRVGYFHL